MLTRSSALCPTARTFAKRFPAPTTSLCAATASSFSSSTRTRASPLPAPQRHQRHHHHHHQQQQQQQQQRAAPISQPCLHTFHPTISIRHASTSTTTQTPPIANNSPGAAQQPQLTWDAFFALRRTRRRIGQACSGVGAIGVTYFGLTTMINNGYDATLSAQLGGFDPLMLMGLSTLGMMGVGWLIGPVFGNMVFNLAYRGVVSEFTRKDSAFFNRIKRHRVDPTASSLANPPPDYYGEKIGSVAGYRRWLKDQRAFNLKTGRYKTKGSEAKTL